MKTLLALLLVAHAQQFTFQPQFVAEWQTQGCLDQKYETHFFLERATGVVDFFGFHHGREGVVRCSLSDGGKPSDSKFDPGNFRGVYRDPKGKDLAVFVAYPRKILFYSDSDKGELKLEKEIDFKAERLELDFDIEVSPDGAKIFLIRLWHEDSYPSDYRDDGYKKRFLSIDDFTDTDHPVRLLKEEIRMEYVIGKALVDLSNVETYWFGNKTLKMTLFNIPYVQKRTGPMPPVRLPGGYGIFVRYHGTEGFTDVERSIHDRDESGVAYPHRDTWGVGGLIYKDSTSLHIAPHYVFSVENKAGAKYIAAIGQYAAHEGYTPPGCHLWAAVLPKDWTETSTFQVDGVNLPNTCADVRAQLFYPDMKTTILMTETPQEVSFYDLSEFPKMTTLSTARLRTGATSNDVTHQAYQHVARDGRIFWVEPTIYETNARARVYQMYGPPLVGTDPDPLTPVKPGPQAAISDFAGSFGLMYRPENPSAVEFKVVRDEKGVDHVMVNAKIGVNRKEHHWYDPYNSSEHWSYSYEEAVFQPKYLDMRWIGGKLVADQHGEEVTAGGIDSDGTLWFADGEHLTLRRLELRMLSKDEMRATYHQDGGKTPEVIDLERR